MPQIGSGNVKFHEKKNKYEAFIPASWNHLHKRKTLGTFYTKEDASCAIELFYEKYVKDQDHVMPSDDFIAPNKISSRAEQVAHMRKNNAFVCIDCAKEFTELKHKRVRCDSCTKKDKQKYYKRYVELNEEQVRKRRLSHTKFLEIPSNRISNNIGSILNSTVKGSHISQHTIKYTGLSSGEELMRHLETTFQPGMTRENYGIPKDGSMGWVIDHIIPRVLYDHTDETEIYKCWNYKNLQALWKSDNEAN